MAQFGAIVHNSRYSSAIMSNSSAVKSTCSSTSLEFHRCSHFIYMRFLIPFVQDVRLQDLPASGTDWQNDAGNRCIWAGQQFWIEARADVAGGSAMFYRFYHDIPWLTMRDRAIGCWRLLECSTNPQKNQKNQIESPEISRIVLHIQPPFVRLCPDRLVSGVGWFCPMDAGHPHTARICRGATVIRVASVLASVTWNWCISV